MTDGADTIDEHLSARENISTAVEREADMLYHAIERSGKLLRPRTKRLGQQPHGLPDKVNFRIGMISRDMRITESGSELEAFSPRLQLYGHEMEPYYRLSRPRGRALIEKARAGLKKKILALARKRANVICVSELGYPAFTVPLDGRISERECQLLAAGDTQFRKEIQEISDEWRCIILCGSYHDVHDLTNKALLFVPGDPHPEEHRKLTTADSPEIGEVIRTARSSGHFIYATELGRISVLICKDAYDLNVFCRYALMGSSLNGETPSDLILVPAFSRVPLVDACREVSYFGRTVVAYVDGCSSPRSSVFVAGKCLFNEYEKRSALFGVSWAERNQLMQEMSRDQDFGIFASVVGSRTGRRS